MLLAELPGRGCDDGPFGDHELAACPNGDSNVLFANEVERRAGERVETVRRRGKYLLIGFASGRTLLVHLRMTGSFRHEANARHLDAAQSACKPKLTKSEMLSGQQLF